VFDSPSCIVCSYNFIKFSLGSKTCAVEFVRLRYLVWSQMQERSCISCRRAQKHASNVPSRDEYFLGDVSNLEQNFVHFLGGFPNCEERILVSSCLSVRPHATTRLPMDGFSRNLKFDDFFENLSRKLKCHYNLKTITGTLNEDQ